MEHTHMYARTHARTHARSHTHTQALVWWLCLLGTLMTILEPLLSLMFRVKVLRMTGGGANRGKGREKRSGGVGEVKRGAGGW